MDKIYIWQVSIRRSKELPHPTLSLTLVKAMDGTTCHFLVCACLCVCVCLCIVALVGSLHELCSLVLVFEIHVGYIQHHRSWSCSANRLAWDVDDLVNIWPHSRNIWLSYPLCYCYMVFSHVFNIWRNGCRKSNILLKYPWTETIILDVLCGTESYWVMLLFWQAFMTCANLSAYHLEGFFSWCHTIGMYPM